MIEDYRYESGEPAGRDKLICGLHSPHQSSNLHQPCLLRSATRGPKWRPEPAPEAHAEIEAAENPRDPRRTLRLARSALGSGRADLRDSRTVAQNFLRFRLAAGRAPAARSQGPARRLRRDINIRGPLGARRAAREGAAGRKEAGRSERGCARNRPSGTDDPERELGD